MAFIPKLYFSPGAVSLATHIALEEVGAPYRLERVDLHNGNREYRSVHPLGRVPALEVGPGVMLTETPALLGYLADSAPTLNLLPRQALERARANEWMSLLASAVHVSFLCLYRPARFTSDPTVAAGLKLDGKRQFEDWLRYLETRLPDQGFVLGDRYSLCDAYLSVFFLWAQRMGLPLAELPRYRQLAKTVLQRPAVQRALEQEGFGHLSVDAAS